MCRKRSEPEMLGFIFFLYFSLFFFSGTTFQSLKFNQVAGGMQGRKDRSVSLLQRED